MKSLCALAFFVCCFVTSCSSQVDVTGKWYGSFDAGGFDMRLIFTIEHSEEGYTATMLSPDQTDREIPVTSITFINNELAVGISDIDFSYTGKLNSNEVIEGTFTQGGQTFALNLSREEIKLATRIQEPQPPYPYKEENITFQNEKAAIKLAGTLTLPRSSGEFTAVVLVSGSGAQNRNEELLGHKPFLVLADYLTRRGIAVLRFDDRGVGESEGDYRQATIADFATDAEAAINYLKTRKEVNKNKIGIIGHSEGGGIAFMLAAEQKPAFIVTLAGPGVNGPDLLRLQRKAIFTASGIPEIYIDQFNDYMTQAQELAVRASGRAELEEGIRKLFTGTQMEKQIEPAVNQLSSPEIVSFLKYDPQSYFKKINCPVLALNGMLDMQVTCGENLSAIMDGITANGNKEVTTKPYFGLNHLFQTATTGLPGEYGTIDETINNEVLQDIADWLLKR